MLQISELSRLTLTSAWAEVRRLGKREALALRVANTAGIQGIHKLEWGTTVLGKQPHLQPGAGYRDRDATERSEASASR
jgi:hypothetical protein